MVLETLPSLKTEELNTRESVHLLRRVFPILLNETFVLGATPRIIGREPPSNGLKLDDGEASRHHASIAIEHGQAILVDLNSTNGTIVNDDRIERHVLMKNDVVQIGRTLFVYCCLEMGIASLGGFRNSRASFVRLEAEDLARKASGSALSILIHGPTGAGKERLAEKIHEWSGRAGKFVAVNCGAIPRELIASELFGHLKGSFSGASEQRSGLFQTAHEGTLFLDEVAELPLEVQATLLRVCESNEIRPVGADRSKFVDVRILTATHVDLDERVLEGRFREDLLARLRGVTCVIPPLNERRDEILHLFHRFTGERPFGLTVAKRLLNASWRENVRGVKKAAEQALLYREESSTILPQHLPPLMCHREPPVTAKTNESHPDLERLLREARGNVAQVARRLGVHRQQVYRWITRANLNPQDFRR